MGFLWRSICIVHLSKPGSEKCRDFETSTAVPIFLGGRGGLVNKINTAKEKHVRYLKHVIHNYQQQINKDKSEHGSSNGHLLFNLNMNRVITTEMAKISEITSSKP